MSTAELARAGREHLLLELGATLLALLALTFTLAVSAMFVTGEMATGQGLALDHLGLVRLHLSQALGACLSIEHVQTNVVLVDRLSVSKVLILTVLWLV